MTIYLLFYILIIAFSLSSIGVGSASNECIGVGAVAKKRGASVYLLTAILVFILGMRHQSMGVDLGFGWGRGYLGSFDAINDYSWLEVSKLPSFLNYEKGYILFNKLVGSFGKDRQMLLIASACVAIIPFGQIVHRKSRFPFMSFVIYLGLPVFLINYSGLRQAIAIGVTFFSIKYVQSKKLVPFLLLVILAALFHTSAIVFLVAYPVYHWKKKRVYEILSVLLIPFVYLYRYPLFAFLSRLLRGRESMPDNNGAAVLFIAFMLIYIFTLVFRKQQTPEYNGYSNLFYCACLAQTFSGLYSTAIRVGYYFMIYLVLLLPEMLWGIQTKQNWRQMTLIRWGISVAFIAFGLYSIYNSTWAMAYPYKFFWE